MSKQKGERSPQVTGHSEREEGEETRGKEGKGGREGRREGGRGP